MRDIHTAAFLGFSSGAESYASGRPEYPAPIRDWLGSDLGIGPGIRVLDLGAGTGKFTAVLLDAGASVAAVEPVPAMLERLRQAYPGCEAKQGTAQAIPFSAETFDAAVCAQSFHWFATEPSLAEVWRVLKPGGRLVLIWNVRDESVTWVAALTRIIDLFAADAPRYRTGLWRTLFPAKGWGPLKEVCFPHAHTGPPEQVIVDRVLSTSFIAALPPASKAEVRARVEGLIQKTPELQGRAQVSFPYKTVAFCCRKL